MQGASSPSCNIAVITNPLSGKNKRGGFKKFESLVQNYPAITHYVASQPDEIVHALVSCEQQNVKIIIVNGGDGTLQLVLTFLRNEEQKTYSPKLLLLQAGTTSMNYGDVGCRGSHKSILDKVMEGTQSSIFNFTEVERSSIRMRLLAENKSICGMFFGAGAVHSGILYCRQNIHTKGMRGELGPSLAMIRFLFDWITLGKLVKPVKAAVYVDTTEEIEGVFTIIVATSLHRLLMGAFPFWSKKPLGDHFNLTMIRRNAPKPLRAFLNILRGRAPRIKNHENYYHSHSPNVVKMSIYDGFTLDGELFGSEGVQSDIELETTKSVTFLM